ncbi:hypothetical protein DL96DRAFT_1611603 [Flagelloscypha sp. PMI_526]|nr:hypothetical protein DL96DRAFT_1611603 [Flagelloscypha sp. PMI_526]
MSGAEVTHTVSESTTPTPQEAPSTPPEAAPEPYKVWKPSNYSGPARPSLPDSYFQPSSSDLKAAQASLSQKSAALNDAPLQLRATREAAAKARLERWPITTLRIRFSDRTQLEREFKSTDKIISVYAFVRPLLREDAQKIKFVLYSTPPKRDLKVSDPAIKTQTLAQLGLAPSSVIHVRWPDENANMNASTYGAPLLPEVLAKAEELPIPKPDPALARPSNEPNGPTLESVGKDISKAANDVMKKMPKWFQAGMKK